MGGNECVRTNEGGKNGRKMKVSVSGTAANVESPPETRTCAGSGMEMSLGYERASRIKSAFSGEPLDL